MAAKTSTAMESNSPKAAADTYDVIVVGGGPGGATTASYLSRAGFKTLLVDKAKWPRDKICGDAISGKSISVLRELGLDQWVEREPHGKADGVIFSAPNGYAVTIPFPKKIDESKMKDQREHRYIQPGYVVRREIYDNLLWSYAQKQEHVTTLEEFKVSDLLWEGPQVVGIEGTTKSGEARAFRAKVVVGADGALSKVAEKTHSYDFENKAHDHWIGAFRVYFKDVKGLTDNIEIHFVEGLLPGYFWIFPVDNGMCNVGAGMIETDLRKPGKDGKKPNMKATSWELMRSHPMFKARFEGATEVPGTYAGWLLPCGSERRILSGNGFVLVGDAGGLIDPFSGEGIGNAMVSGKYAAQTITEAFKAGTFSAGFFKAYDQRVWDALGHELDTSYKLQQMGRHTWLLNYLIKRAATKERVRNTISDMLADREKKEELAGWWFYIKLLFL
ncbi:MAG TPA: geranylgeranyl reductase family protein [Candidatus Thermoplasmatota archaeon]|jgi:geranylgeranyl reductase family protein|nr:geranylgeranyl reductase family protein [Candidatus Thermoplasmatota archaeon]